MNRFFKRLVWFSSLLVAHSVVMEGGGAIAQILAATENVSREDLATIRYWGEGIQDSGLLNRPIPMEDLYGYCPEDGNWVHNLAFDPDTQIVLMVRDCNLVQIDYRFVR